MFDEFKRDDDMVILEELTGVGELVTDETTILNWKVNITKDTILEDGDKRKEYLKKFYPDEY